MNYQTLRQTCFDENSPRSQMTSILGFKSRKPSKNKKFKDRIRTNRASSCHEGPWDPRKSSEGPCGREVLHRLVTLATTQDAANDYNNNDDYDDGGDDNLNEINSNRKDFIKMQQLFKKKVFQHLRQYSSKSTYSCKKLYLKKKSNFMFYDQPPHQIKTCH